MAKKTVATLQTSSKKLTKAIKMVKSPKSRRAIKMAIAATMRMNARKCNFNFVS